MTGEAQLRRLTEADLPGVDELRQLAGWNQTPADWRRLLRLEPEGCFVAEVGGRIAGSVTTTTYARELAWVGMMLVHPQFQRRGIGTQLLRHALDYLGGRGIGCIRLDATPAGRPLYERFGFVAEATLTRWHRAGGIEHPRLFTPPEATRQLAPEDWPAAAALEARAFGIDRLPLLRELAKECRCVRVWPPDGEVAGWGMLRRGATADHLGPVVCTELAGATSLAAQLLDAAETRAVLWDTPDQNREARTLAERSGFTALRPLTRMRRGEGGVRSEARTLFAIADPAVG